MELQRCHYASMASRSMNMYHLLTGPLRQSIYLSRTVDGHRRWRTAKLAASRWKITGSAAQESATATVIDKTETAAAPEKPKPAALAKPAPKDLPELMEEDVIPSLRSTLEGQEDISQVVLSFSGNRLEGSFLKKDVPYYVWAFFPDGVLRGPKGFSLSSYGSGVSTVEPFLIDEKRITSKHVVFWVVKRLAAQGILPAWRE